MIFLQGRKGESSVVGGGYATRGTVFCPQSALTKTEEVAGYLGWRLTYIVLLTKGYKRTECFLFCLTPILFRTSTKTCSFVHICTGISSCIKISYVLIFSVSITSNVVGSNPAHGEVYSIQYYEMKFVSDLRQVGEFPRVFRFPQPWKKTECGVKYHNTNPVLLLDGSLQ